MIFDVNIYHESTHIFKPIKLTFTTTELGLPTERQWSYLQKLFRG